MHCTVLHKNQLRDELSFERLNAESFDQFFGAYTNPNFIFEKMKMVKDYKKNNVFYK